MKAYKRLHVYRRLFWHPSSLCSQSMLNCFALGSNDSNPVAMECYCRISTRPAGSGWRLGICEHRVSAVSHDEGKVFLNATRTRRAQWSGSSRVLAVLRRRGNGAHHGGLGRFVPPLWWYHLGPRFTSDAGYSLGGTSLAENQLDPYIQQAKDQVCFLPRSPGVVSSLTLYGVSSDKLCHRRPCD